MAKKFPDLNKDGKVTQADVLMGRGVDLDRDDKAMGSLMMPREGFGIGSIASRAAREVIKKFASKKGSKAADEPAKKSKVADEPADGGVEEGIDIDLEQQEDLLSTRNGDALYFSKEQLKALREEEGLEGYAEMMGEFATIREVDDEIIEKGTAIGYDKERIKRVLEGKSVGIDQIRTLYNNMVAKRMREAEDDAARDNLNQGSMLVPSERQKRNIGALVSRLVTKAVLTPELKAKAFNAKKVAKKAGEEIDLENVNSPKNQEFLDSIVKQAEANEDILKNDFGLTNNQLKVFAYISPDLASYADAGSYFISKLEKDGGTELLSKLMSPMRFKLFEKRHGYKFETKKELEKFYQDYLKLFEKGADDKLRAKKQKGGSMMVPPEMEMPVEEPPVDTYDNISPEEKAQNDATMLDDGEMEEEYVDYVAEQVLEPEEQDYLFKVLDADPKLEGILDKVMLSASEFAGSGEVEGPGTGISDSIPARLSDGEFVITRKATDQIGADNLQQMMDDAERAADGSLMGMANGGEANMDSLINPEETADPLDRFGMQKDDEREIESLMLNSSRMPSLMNR